MVDKKKSKKNSKSKVKSLTTKEAIKKAPKWCVASNTVWDKEWLEQPYELFGDSDFAY
jgi:hypothetical protein